MKKALTLTLTLLSLIGFIIPSGWAYAAATDDYLTARIVDIQPSRSKRILETDIKYYNVVIEIPSNAGAPERITIESDRFSAADTTAPRIGDRVTVSKFVNHNGETIYAIEDHYRLPAIALIGVFFIFLVVFLARRKGVGSLLGLAVSILALKFAIVPALIGGANPIMATLLGSFGIATVSMLLAHGFNQNTVLSLISTLATLLVGTGLATIFIRLAKLSGLGSEGAFYLTASGTNFDYSGLLLGAIIIGMLGVLDDVTTAQTAAVAELKKANSSFTTQELYRRGIAIGREHIASLVNTLVLAYAGVGLPLFLLFTLNTNQPLWVTINGEPIAEEVIRTLAGSSALILAVPISTWLAAQWIARKHQS